MLRHLFAALVLLSFSHLASDQVSAKLEGSEWRLTELGGKPMTVPEEHAATLTFDAEGKNISGSTGCNRMFGVYELNGSALHFTGVGMTRRACVDSAIMDQEQAFTHALDSTTAYRISDRKLELLNGETVLAKFASSSVKAQEAPTPAAGVQTADPSKWVGRWLGPEGTELYLSKKAEFYLVAIRSLDGVHAYKGQIVGDRIQFTRNDKEESIHAGTGKDTGMKWLFEKKDCLIIKTGEGFCRD